MLSIKFLFDLSIILLCTKLFGLVTRKVQMPQVVGALLAGIILGPACLGIVSETDFISKLAELGVIVLMFQAGFESDFKELKKCGKASLLIALLGILVPLAGGFLLGMIFNNDGSIFIISNKKFLENIFIGLVLTATSVSITVETLQEMGKLKTSSGVAIMSAAVIDDIIGIILLTVITSFNNPSIHIGLVLLRILIFLLFSILIGFIARELFSILIAQHGAKKRIAVFAFSFCLILSFLAEEYFGIANITGAYIAGMVFSNLYHLEYIESKIDTLSFMLLSPVFFASIGIGITLESTDARLMLFTIALVIIAIMTKISGCSLGAELCGYDKEESLQIGIGMVSRGEVALIIANKGAILGLLSKQYFTPIVIMVIVTTLVTPILLKLAFSNRVYGVRRLRRG